MKLTTPIKLFLGGLSNLKMRTVLIACTMLASCAQCYSEPTADCHNDVSCYPDWRLNQAIGVVFIRWTTDTSPPFTNHTGTGVIINTYPPSQDTYILTANHFIENQAEASVAEFFWYYQTPTCNGTPPELADFDSIRRVLKKSGADYLSGSDSDHLDFTLLRLRQQPPNGSIALGWTTDTLSEKDSVTCIHHPGDTGYKRISFGVITNNINKAYWAVSWTDGLVQQGSSGSPLFNNQKQVVGILHSELGLSTCVHKTLTLFTPFYKIYPLISQWIHPQFTNGYSVTDLGALGNFGSTPYAIDKYGNVVGSSQTKSLATHAFRYDFAAGTNVDLSLADTNNTKSEPYSMNNNGQIVGYSENLLAIDPDKAVNFHTDGTVPFSIHNDLKSTMPQFNPVHFISEADGNNNKNQVVGYVSAFYISNGVYVTRPFLYSGGQGTELPTLGGNAIAYGIGDNGDIVGGSYNRSNEEHGFLIRNGIVDDLGVLPGGTYSAAFAVNPTGLIVGEAETAVGDTHAVISTGGGLTDIGTLGGDYSSAFGVNTAGDIVGESNTNSSSALNVAFLWTGGHMTNLNKLISSGWILTSASAINDNGYIACDGINLSAGTSDAVILTPAVSCAQSDPSRSIDSVSLQNGELKLTFGTVPGNQYKVEYNNNLAGQNWSILNGILTATDWSTTVSDPMTQKQRFYRLSAP